MKKATVILIHAAWTGAWQWNYLTPILEEVGINTITPDLPGHGTLSETSKTIQMEDYVSAIVDILDQQDEPVYLLGHSFAGIIISQIAERRANKIKGLLYLSAFLLPNELSFLQAVNGAEGSVAVDNFYVSEDQQFALIKEEAMKEAFSHDVPQEAFDSISSYFVPEPIAPLAHNLALSEENWGSLPRYYIETTQDKAIPLSMQRTMQENAGVTQSFTIEASHCPNFSAPQELANHIITIINL